MNSSQLFFLVENPCLLSASSSLRGLSSITLSCELNKVTLVLSTFLCAKPVVMFFLSEKLFVCLKSSRNLGVFLCLRSLLSSHLGCFEVILCANLSHSHVSCRLGCFNLFFLIRAGFSRLSFVVSTCDT